MVYFHKCSWIRLIYFIQLRLDTACKSCIHLGYPITLHTSFTLLNLQHPEETTTFPFLSFFIQRNHEKKERNPSTIKRAQLSLN